MSTRVRLSDAMTGLFTLAQVIPSDPSVSLNHIIIKPKEKPRLGTREIAILVPTLHAK